MKSLPFVPGVLEPTSGPGGTTTTLAGAVWFYDDFITAGHVKDAALLNESDPASKFSTVADAGDWLVTVIDAATDGDFVITAADDAHGGHLTLTSTDADNDALQMQVNGEAFKLKADRSVVFECRFKLDDVDTADWFVGLAITDTTILTAVTDYVGFADTANSGNIKAVNGKDDTAEIGDTDSAGQQLSDTGIDLADDTFVTVRFECDGVSKIRYYVNGVLKNTHSTDIPDNETLTPSIALRNASAAASTMTVDYVVVVADR